MKQNVYDDPEFFAGYAALRENESGLNLTLEQPALQSLLPPLNDLRVLDLGCGFGHFARFALKQGASEITAVDISKRMLNEAGAELGNKSVRLVHAAVEDYMHEPSTVDVVVSSLTLHYVQDFSAVVEKVFTWLGGGGMFVLSVEHPICTAMLSGWHLDTEGARQFWPVDHYGDEGQRTQHWFIDGVIKYHRTVGTYVNTLVDRGFALVRLLEPEPVSAFIEKRPDLRDERRRPPVLLLAARKPLG